MPLQHLYVVLHWVAACRVVEAVQLMPWTFELLVTIGHVDDIARFLAQPHKVNTKNRSEYDK